VTHPFIIDLKLSFENKSFVYFVMEYARGGPVDTLLSIKAIKGSKKNERNIRFKKLGEEGVRFIASCVVLALEHLHRYDIMYRDLKPENILIFDDGYIKLADFGLSKIMCGEEKSRTQAGTVVYFAP
jgi:serine/threonine protein kinase